MTDAHRTPDTGPRRERRASDLVGLAIAATLVLGLFSAPLYALLRDRSPSDSMGMGDFGGTAVELDTLQPSLASLYRGAREHAGHFQQIPCFCGCQEGRLEHRHLLDCYVLRDGKGWESHATGCRICQGEAKRALRLLEAGTPVADVRRQIVDEFGMPAEMRDLQEG